MSIKKTTAQDLAAFVKATEEARKMPLSQTSIDRINKIANKLKTEQSQTNSDNQRDPKAARNKNFPSAGI